MSVGIAHSQSAITKKKCHVSVLTPIHLTREKVKFASADFYLNLFAVLQALNNIFKYSLFSDWPNWLHRIVLPRDEALSVWRLEFRLKTYKVIAQNAKFFYRFSPTHYFFLKFLLGVVTQSDSWHAMT
ncbi:hypothetical protein [Polaromonas vacuolata]|uniref:hypothetical protein n=1 Tax=Polaromonas vacuolata TaxID=37448 RepID=UPI001456B0E5|nr:hypothetical protein [Polaromonas vacuolata]